VNVANFFEQFLVWSHVSAGVTALVVAPVAMLVQKGGARHRRWGKVYFWAMFAIFVTALGLVVYRPNFFLFVISILSFYGAFSGYRALYRKRGGGWPHAWLDWAAAAMAFAAGLGFIGWGAGTYLGLVPGGLPTAFSILGIVFGLLLGSDALTDLRSFRRPPADRNWWWYYHMQRLLASFIAAVTAFAVQNVGPHLPAEAAWLVWVAPGLIGGVGIGLWVSHYRRKFQPSRRTRRPASIFG
jgi:uncharacterized membrane protein